MSTDSKISSVPSFGPPPPPPPAAAMAAPAAGQAAARAGAGASNETMLGKLTKLLGGAMDDISSLEVLTYTSSGADSATGAQEQLTKNMRLRAMTRIELDGDAVVCVPLLENGQPDEALWKIHNEVVQQARQDRKETMALAVQLTQKLVSVAK